MRQPFMVHKDVYMVGGAKLSHPYDCAVYLLDAGELVLIDAGAGQSFDRLVANIKSLGFKPERLKAVLATHAHIDHTGSLHRFREAFGAQIIAHENDAAAIEQETGIGAEAYGIGYMPCPVDVKIQGDEKTFDFGTHALTVVHIPGHTPGSIAAYTDIDHTRVLFGQDVHGPYHREWGADFGQAKLSLQRLIDLKADILCEGHFGIFQPATAVARYIQRYLDAI